MKHRFSIALPSCGSCISHSHCRECIEAIGRTLSDTVPVEEICTDPSKKMLIIDSPLSEDALTDLLDDMGVFIVAQDKFTRTAQ